MKRAPSPRPPWIPTCAIEHASGSVIDFPIVNDLATLLWTINLGCIDLNQWYARCDDVDRPDYLHFDLDPVGDDVSFASVRQAAIVVNETLVALGMSTCVKTTGSRGLHIYVPIVRGPTQKQVWEVSKTIALDVARRHPQILTAVYKKAKRPAGRVLVDYNQNAWGRTLASVYSVRPRPRATVSMPVTWDEVSAGVTIDDFRIDNAPARLRHLGDLWAPIAAAQQPLRPHQVLVRPPLRPQTSVAGPESRDVNPETSVAGCGRVDDEGARLRQGAPMDAPLASATARFRAHMRCNAREAPRSARGCASGRMRLQRSRSATALARGCASGRICDYNAREAPRLRRGAKRGGHGGPFGAPHSTRRQRSLRSPPSSRGGRARRPAPAWTPDLSCRRTPRAPAPGRPDSARR